MSEGLRVGSQPVRGDAGGTALAGAPWPAPFPPGAPRQSIPEPGSSLSKVLAVAWGQRHSTAAASSCAGPPRGPLVKPRCRALSARCSQAELGHVSWKLKSACRAVS